MKHLSISEYLVSYLLENGVKRIFGIPGSYIIDLIDNISKEEDLTYVSAFHESGAGFMAQGYAQVTGRFGVLCTTEGPGALNAVNALASAKADGDSILFIQGIIPDNKLNVGALQDTMSFDLDLYKCFKGLSVFQGCVKKPSDFVHIFEKTNDFLSKKNRVSGPVHLQISIDSFPASVSKGVFFPQLDEPDCLLDSQLSSVVEALNHAKNPLLLLGHGVFQSRCIPEIEDLLKLLPIPTMTTSRGVSCVDHSLPTFIGQYGLFPHVRAAKWLAENPPDLLLALGTSMNEFATNSWSPNLSRIPTLIHVDYNEKVFGRLARGSKIASNTLSSYEQKCFDIKVDLKIFINRLISYYKSRECSALPSTKRVIEFKKNNPNNVDRPDEFIGDDVAVLSSQRVAVEISDCIQQGINSHNTKISQLSAINYVGDTGSSKLLIAHYCDFSKGLNKQTQFRCFMPGSYDTMGYSIGCALGVSLGSKDMGEDALTIALVGDGAMYMQNEIYALNRYCENNKLIVIILNDGKWNYVSQGFAAIKESILDELEFSFPRIDVEKMIKSFGVKTIFNVRSPKEIFSKELNLIESILEKNEFPVIINCLVNPNVLGPGYERYNNVRKMIGKEHLNTSQMKHLLEDLQSKTENNNSISLYGDIRRIFEGNLHPPTELVNEDDTLQFGIGVCSFSDMVSEISDSCMVNGRVFIKYTDDALQDKFTSDTEHPEYSNIDEGKITPKGQIGRKYVTPYFLGFRQLDTIKNLEVVTSLEMKKNMTMHDMLEILLETDKGEARMTAFIGIVEFGKCLGTSLKHAPTRGENILEEIDEYARKPIPLPSRSGVIVGFAQSIFSSKENPNSNEVLLDKMFFHNPHDDKGSKFSGEDNVEAYKTVSDYEIRSHTHGIFLESDDGGIFVKDGIVDELVINTKIRKFKENFDRNNKIGPKSDNMNYLTEIFGRDFKDSDHVIPNSILSNFIFLKFHVESVEEN